MTKQEQEQIIQFQPFQRSDKARSIHTDGTGLSLYLSNKIIQAHQGQLFIYSQGKDMGTVAWFWVGTE